MRACVCVCVYVCVCVCMRTLCAHVCAHTCVCVCVRARAHPYLYVCKCVPVSIRCDGIEDCRDSSDEDPGLCYYEEGSSFTFGPGNFPPAAIHFDGRGSYSTEQLDSFSHCPQSHFLCAGLYL